MAKKKTSAAQGNDHVNATGTADSASGRCSWSSADDAQICQTLRKAKEDSLQADNGWKKAAWTRCSDDLKDSPGPCKTTEKCRDHWGKSIKASFLEVQKLRNLSGFGWDEGLQMVTASEEVWDAYIAKHPKAAYWKENPFPLYNDVLFLVEGIVATGAEAFHAGAPGSTTTSHGRGHMAAGTRSASEDPRTPSEPASAAGDSNFMTPRNDDLVPSSPIQPRRKRLASSPPPTTSRKVRKRNADATSDVATAIAQIAQSLKGDTSPHGRMRQKALEVLQDDADLSETEETEVMLLFANDDDAKIAQIYAAGRTKEKRTNFIRKALAKAKEEENM
ncbi:MYB transcription factor 08 [Mycena venus]|uniref:MYB transcription factor 08 n=1 Tax=Mycena venus TaxID=2733690 RepID=A0A8H6Z4D5_9AGAR|nr:MYB transcription factor 08 [Mycena venus]